MHNQDTYINFTDPKYGNKDTQVPTLGLNGSVISHGLRHVITLLLIRRHSLYTSAMMLDK